MIKDKTGETKKLHRQRWHQTNIMMMMTLGKKTEKTCVGAGLGGGFQHTVELHAIQYKTNNREYFWQKKMGIDHV